MRDYIEHSILDAAAATGVGATINVRDYKHIGLSFATDGGGDAALTIKVQGSFALNAPTFSNAQSVTNLWDYIEVIDLEDGAAIDGDTGITVASADDYRLFKLNNADGLRWLNVEVTARSAGEVTVRTYLVNDTSL